MFRRSATRRRPRKGSGRLSTGLGLAGERRLARSQCRRLEQTRVGGHEVAALEQEDVATHHLGRRHHRRVPVAHDARPRRRQRASAATARSARYSCRKPIRAFKTTMARMAAPSIRSPTAIATAAAPISTQMTTPRNWPIRMSSGRISRPARIEFGPSTASRRRASSAPSPAVRSLASAPSTSSIDRACQASVMRLRVACSLPRSSHSAGGPAASSFPPLGNRTARRV